MLASRDDRVWTMDDYNYSITTNRHNRNTHDSGEPSAINRSIWKF